MSGRTKKSELEFGSDSFLDVLANIVGILIILIVIVGARLSRAPLPSLRQAQTDVPAAPVAPPVEVEPDEPEPVVQLPPETLEPDTAPPEIAAGLQAIDADLAEIADQAAAAENALQESLTAAEDAQQQLAAETGSLETQAARLAQTRLLAGRLEQALVQKREQLSGVLAEFEQVKHEQPKAVQIKHRLTPIGQSIVGEELHFRLSGNRVAPIPIKLLVDRVKAQIERQASFLARYPTHEGSVGPVDGFSLKYLVTSQTASSHLEQMRRQGEVRVRLSVTQWLVEPEPDLQTENADTALRKGSKFQTALLTAPARASVTFWVYPDSFGLCRKLQAAAHAEGFTVSARPLPTGLPIAGSPGGTRSVGQ